MTPQNIKSRNRATISNFNKLCKALDRKISIKVGILEPEASQKHSGTDLTMAHLGVIHEFGAIINKEDGTQINIPARPFLRILLTPEGKRYLNQKLKQYLPQMITSNFKNVELLSQKTANIILDDTAKYLAENALLYIQKSFETGYGGKWEPISEYTLKQRKQSKNPIPLTDTRELRQSITYRIENL